MTHTSRTELVYRMARDVGRLGIPVSPGKLGQDILINQSANLITTLNRETGEVRVRDRWNGELLFEGGHDGWTRCAATTKGMNNSNGTADVDLDDSAPWQRELQDVLREVAA